MTWIILLFDYVYENVNDTFDNIFLTKRNNKYTRWIAQKSFWINVIAIVCKLLQTFYSTLIFGDYNCCVYVYTNDMRGLLATFVVVAV